ncbi:glycosyltransferase [Cyanobium sp. Morenito 9A2]|uniref:glycosyltransferase n=1 Tax=Cyanobium sp. Morenito 9A2 TaxID=2823718 RepID=UPI0020CC0172|nr:glycosyltransferase [Cyanobium sp. Morenito 9A2]MCP9850234.1 glycosyltransferase [Cyanobium sp. Morenito 9A2]
MIYLRVDGGTLPQAHEFRAAADPVPLMLRESLEHTGLADGLNQLIDEVLQDASITLIARMDADDESLPGRMEDQRHYLQAHNKVDILGTACREVDEHGQYLQLKRMPSHHKNIIAALPRRNPINHPTVMMRSRVFSGGLRYRLDVRRTEDYHLWISAARAGYEFANLDQPLLNFQRDSSFFQRRSGWRQAIADFHVRWRAIWELRQITPANLLWAMAAFVLRLLPANIQSFLYRQIR